MRRMLLIVSFVALAGAASGVDQVIFKDGFAITGKRFKEQEMITDKQNGSSVVLPKARGFDIIETGPKWIIFSNKTQQVGKLLENVKGENEYKNYERPFGMKGKSPLPNGIVKVGEWNDNWVRIIRVDMPQTKGFAEIEQRVFSVSPTRIVMPSANYVWYPFFDTREFKPEQVRKMIATHKDLDQEKGTAEVLKRLEIAQFMKDAGWLDQAVAEVELAKKEIPGVWPKDQQDATEKLLAEIRKTGTGKLVVELEKAVKAGRYARAKELIGRFDEKAAEAADAKLFATLKAQVETVEPRYEKAAKLLVATLDRMAGGALDVNSAALGGGLAAGVRVPTFDAKSLALHAAGVRLYAEIHPDTVERLDFFITLAEQSERKRLNGEEPGTTPEKLIALALTGWMKGRNGAEQDVDSALRYWQWRDMLMAYQVEPTKNKRTAIYEAMAKAGAPLGPDEVAQLISYLPPPEPENLQQRSGTEVSPGIYRRNTGPLPEQAKGIDYLVRLPGEYHHGRPARLIVALTHPTAPAEQIVNLLANEAESRGAIVIAPIWTGEYNGAYDWKGSEHFKARAVIRDAFKHFRVDNDRVFLFGYGEGANFAMDLGASHPDLFAGVVAMGANPKYYNMFMHYWRNCQKLPMYVCIGSIAGDAFTNVRRVFEELMPKGYPAIASVYRGRHMEWFFNEVPVMFDWMDPKKRVNGTAVLRVNESLEPWMTMRNEDNRFYWVGSTNIDKKCTIADAASLAKPSNIPGNPPVEKSFYPAEIKADLQGNKVVLNTRGTNNVVLWFDKTMIDWSKPVSVVINGTAPPGYKPKVLTPDVGFMLEQLYESGDRSLLFLNKLEFATIR